MFNRRPNTRQRRFLRMVAAVMLTFMLLATMCAAGVFARWPFAAASRPHAGAPAPGALARLGPADPARVMTITVALAAHAPAVLDRTLAELNNPASPQYRHFLTPAQFAREFGAPPTTEARVERVLRAAGLTIIARSRDRLQLRARGTVRQLEHLFHVSIADYRTANGRRFTAASAAPRLPAGLASAVTGVLGLETLSVAHPLYALQSLQASAGLTPADLASAYDLGPLARMGLDGSNQTIAFAEIDTFKQSDIDTYDRAFGITAPAVQVVPVGAGAAPASTASEATLDIEVAHAVAPHAHLIAYEGGSDTASLVQMFSQIVTEHRAQVLSISLGLCERFVLDPRQAPSGLQAGFTASGQSFFSALDTIFREADALGMSVLVATGDTGAYGCNQLDRANHVLSPSAPATSPYVTAVGGTALFTNANGSYGHEDGWEGPLEGAGSGGGLSQVYTRPSWQTGPDVSNAYSNGMRQVPDIAAAADPLTGYAVYDSTEQCQGQNCWGVVGGTSAAAPFWAALTALANQLGTSQHLGPAGFLDPLLYRLGSGTASPSPYHDVTVGGNLYYPATPGWDFSTGWGSPDGAVFVPRLLAAERGR
jgi:subtilase family serine protease